MLACCVISSNRPYIGGHLVIYFKLFTNTFHCDAVDNTCTTFTFESVANFIHMSICTCAYITLTKPATYHTDTINHLHLITMVPSHEYTSYGAFTAVTEYTCKYAR